MNRTGVQLRLTSQNARQNALQEKYTTSRVENSKNAYQRHVRAILGAARNIALNGRVALQKGFPEVLRIGVKLGELLVNSRIKLLRILPPCGRPRRRPRPRPQGGRIRRSLASS